MKPLHGNIGELSSTEISLILQRNDFAHLACSSKDEIYLVPISYIFEDGYIYSHSFPGKKIQTMRQNPKICFQVEEVEDFFHWNSVIAWGQFEELQDLEASSAMRQIVKRMAEREGEGRRSELEVEMTALFDTAIIFRIKIERSTGRCEGFK